MANSSTEQLIDPEELVHVRPPDCAKCGHEKTYVDCYNCEDGYSDHDCGEDCCCCLDPEPNVTCDICEGDGGYYVCGHCYPESIDDI